MAFLNKTGLERLWLHISSKLNNKVDKVDGKGLSTNDYTTAEKEQLSTLNSLVGDTAVATQINDAISDITPDSLGAVDKEDYYGLVEKEGAIVSAKSLDGTGIKATTHIIATQEGSGVASIDNIRPIVPISTATLTRTGKNLVNVNGIVGYNYITSAGKFSHEITDTGVKMLINKDVSDSWVRMYFYIGTREQLKGKTITASADYNTNVTEENNGIATIGFCTGDKLGGYITNSLDSSLPFKKGVESLTTAIGDLNGKYVYAVFYCGYGLNGVAGDWAEWSNIQVEIGDEATEYEPYNETVLTAELPETIYGGALDWDTGLLTIDRVKKTFTGDEEWTLRTVTDTTCLFESSWTDNLIHAEKDGNFENDIIISHNTPASGSDSVGVWLTKSESQTCIRWCCEYTQFADVDTFKTYVKAQYDAGTPIELVYRVTNSTTHQLTAQQLEALQGVNCVWSNCGDTRAIFNYPIFDSFDSFDNYDKTLTKENYAADAKATGDAISNLETLVNALQSKVAELESVLNSNTYLVTNE